MMKTATAPRTFVERFRSDVLTGLSRPQKAMPAKYFYDDAGSRWFDRICELPEYYPTRTELGIMREHAAAMAACCGSEALILELGAGSLTKVRLLLKELDRPAGFVPVDVSGTHLRAASKDLQREFPNLDIRTVTADFTAPFPIPHLPARKRVAYVPGSTIGNFEVAEADALLKRIAVMVGPGGGLLLGVDLVKPTAVLQAAYNDSAGVTAAFNKNLLARMNRELDADFDLDAFEHRAFFNAKLSRIEMHLRSTVNQTVTVAGQAIRFAEHETIHTENSHKYDFEELAVRAERCGLRLTQNWTDPKRWFGVGYFEAVRIAGLRIEG